MPQYRGLVRTVGSAKFYTTKERRPNQAFIEVYKNTLILSIDQATVEILSQFCITIKLKPCLILGYSKIEKVDIVKILAFLRVWPRRAVTVHSNYNRLYTYLWHSPYSEPR